MKKLIFAFLTSFVLVTLAFFVPKHTYTPRASESFVSQNIQGALSYYKRLRANQLTGKVDFADIEKAQNQIKTLESSRLQSALNLAWEEVGPDNVGGRTRAILIDKDSANVMYAGGVAGGLWKTWNGGASWRILFDSYQANTISCITQAINGDIYVGTGEGHYYGFGTGVRGMIGTGIYKSTNRGATWTLLPSTIPSAANSTSATFIYVNEVAHSTKNAQRIYAATNKGLRLSLNGGQTWINPVLTADSLGFCGDVQVGKDETVIVSFGGVAYISPSGDVGTFTKLSTGVSGKLPSSGVSRIEFAISPQDTNYIYACLASNQGDLYGVYKTINGGGYWQNIASALVDPLGGQGDYDNCITVSSVNKDRIYVGGTTFFTCFYNSSVSAPIWARVSVQYPGSQDLYRYVHPDLHVLICDPNDPNVLYVGCDGGIFKTSDLQTNSPGGPAFIDLNNGYNVTQFYAIAPTPNGGVVGGTQDNGTQHINFGGGTSQSAVSIGGGDGGYTEASFIIPGAFFSTVYYGALNRSLTGTSGSFYSDRIMNLPNFNNPGFASFITPISLYESFNDKITHDSVDYVIKPTDNTAIGGILSIKSRVAGVNSQIKKYFNDTNKVVRTVGETIRVQDILQSRIAVGFDNSVWLTKHAIDESGPVNWIRIGWNQVADVQSRYFGEAKVLKFSKDGDYLYVGTWEGNLFRFSNLKAISYDDTLTGEIGNPNCLIQCKKILQKSGRALCGIAVDPNNNDKVVVTYGNYGNNDYVFVSNNATAATPTFSLIQNNLPFMPVYDAVIDMNDANKILIGTEYGVWSTDDNGATWAQSSTFPKVPTLSLRQQFLDYSATVYGTGIIYAGTHGRGAFRTQSLVGIKKESSNSASSDLYLSVFPNPAKDIATVNFTWVNNAGVRLQIFNLQGKLIKTILINNPVNGSNQINIPLENFEAGTYLLSMQADEKRTSCKFVVMK